MGSNISELAFEVLPLVKLVAVMVCELFVIVKGSVHVSFVLDSSPYRLEIAEAAIQAAQE